MSKLILPGPWRLRLSGLATINRIAIATGIRRAFGRKLDPTWDINLEIGVRFWRHQFTRAMQAETSALGRVILDSVQTDTDDVYAVDVTPQATPKGHWYHPHTRKSEATVLYLHGGGYAFYGAMSHRFGAMLAHHTGAPVFAPDYRLTPEHPHPAQADDALAAWHYVTANTNPAQVVAIGDSAGGHMMLMLLQCLRDHGLPQPAMGIGLCPWTDIGDRGASLHGNDPTDLVQGWMALQFGVWLDPQGQFGRSALSPINHDYAGLALLYLQTGGREILHDMIVDFARVQARNGADVLLDDWPTMPHDFQLFDSTQPTAQAALARITAAVRSAVDGDTPLTPTPRTLVSAGRFGPVS